MEQGTSDRGAALRRAGATFGPAAAIVALQLIVFPVPTGIFVQGLIVGMLSALVALGMALIYRTNGILNFAQADLGGVPAVLVVLLMTSWGWSYFIAVPVGLLAAVLVGAVVELAIIRRFFKAPRLILTVATLGLAQLLVVGSILLQRAFGERLLSPRVEAPFSFTFTVSPVIFNANSVLAIVISPVVMIVLAVALQRTNFGIAVRAAATSGDRAALLGVPVKRLQTVVWAGAGLLAFIATFLRAGVLGLPVLSALSIAALLRGLAALMLGRLTNLTAIASSAIAIGVLEQGMGWQDRGTWRGDLPVDLVLALVIGVSLVLRRRSTGRSEVDATSSWQAAEEVRPIPRELRHLPEVRWTRLGLGAVVVTVALVLPHVLAVSDSLKASAVLIYGILALSLVVLTGWAGQVSLGQVAFFAIGAIVGAKASVDHHADITLALLLASLAGGLVALLVGLPALRLRGLYLAVTTFAFAVALASYPLSDRYDWVPDKDRVPRNPLFGRVSIDSPTRIYYVVLAGLVLVIVALRGIRRSRTGRVLLALRENERAAEAYGISATRAKLTAFALSGAVAAFAGCLFVWHQQAYDTGSFEPGWNFSVFTMAVIGGIGSVPGALLGALYLMSTGWYLRDEWRLFATGFGVLLVLLVIPSGLGGMLYRLRDLLLRTTANRRGIVVPSMVADVGPPPAPPPPIDPPDDLHLDEVATPERLVETGG